MWNWCLLIICWLVVAPPAQAGWAIFQAQGGTGVGPSSCPANGGTLPGLNCNADGSTALVADSGNFCEGIGCVPTGSPTNYTVGIYVCPASTASPPNSGCNAGVDALSGLANGTVGGSSPGACGTFLAPCATPRFAMQNVRTNAADWVLLAKGNTWTNQAFGNLTKSGRTCSAPALYSSYDPSFSHTANVAPVPDPPSSSLARPILQVSVTWATTQGTPIANLGTLNNIAVVGLDLYAFTRDPNNAGFTMKEGQLGQGFAIQNAFSMGVGNCMLIEDNRTRYFLESASTSGIQNTSYNFSTNGFWRRNTFYHEYCENDNCQFGQGWVVGGTAGGPAGFVWYENIFDQNYDFGNTTNFLWWVYPNGRLHNVYIQGDGANGDWQNSLNSPAAVTANVFANDGGGSQFRSGGVFTHNLSTSTMYNLGIQWANPGVTNQIDHNVIVNAGPQWPSTVATAIAGGGVAGYEQWVFPSTGGTITNNFIINNPLIPQLSSLMFNPGGNNTTIFGNTIFATGKSAGTLTPAAPSCGDNIHAAGGPGSSQCNGAIRGIAVNTPGTGYIENSTSITSANLPSAGAACNPAATASTCSSFTSGPNYIEFVVPSTANIATIGNLMFSIPGYHSGVPQGPFGALLSDGTRVTLFTPFTGSGVDTLCNPNCPGGSKLYYPWYQIATTGGSGQNLWLDVFVAGTAVVGANWGGSDSGFGGERSNLGGNGYLTTDTNITVTPGTACGNNIPCAGTCPNGWSCTGSTPSGSGVTFQPTSVTSGNTLSPVGCNLASQNNSDPTGTNANSCSNYTDPGRTVGSYYSQTGKGWTPTFNSTLTTASIAGAGCGTSGNCVLTVTAMTGGQISLGDAVAWSTPTQTKSDYITFNGGGTIATLTLTASPCSTFPSGCSANNFTGVAVQCVSCASGGSGAVANVSVDGNGTTGRVTGFLVTSGGSNYVVGDTVSVFPSAIGGTGSVVANTGFSARVKQVSGGGIFLLDTYTASNCAASGCATNASATYTSVPLIGGRAVGVYASGAAGIAYADVTVTNGQVSNVVIHSGSCSGTTTCGGTGYMVGDILSTVAGPRTQGMAAYGPGGYNPTMGIGGVPINDGCSSSGNCFLGSPNFTVTPATFGASPAAGTCGGSACTGNGGTGTYLLTGLNSVTGSLTGAGTYTGNQLISLMSGANVSAGQHHGNWNPNLTACAVNTYLMAGFGVTDTCNPNQ